MFRLYSLDAKVRNTGNSSRWKVQSLGSYYTILNFPKHDSYKLIFAFGVVGFQTLKLTSHVLQDQYPNICVNASSVELIAHVYLTGKQWVLTERKEKRSQLPILVQGKKKWLRR